MSCFVWRFPLAEDFFTNGMSKFAFVRDELLNKKILRQGWGFEDLLLGKPAYVAAYGGDLTVAEDRFNILSPMLDIAVGDKNHQRKRLRTLYRGKLEYRHLRLQRTTVYQQAVEIL